MIKWLLSHFAGAAIRFVFGAIFGAVCVIYSFSPAEWLASIIVSPPPTWIVHPYFRISILLVGIIAIGLSIFFLKKSKISAKELIVSTKADAEITKKREYTPDAEMRAAIDEIYTALDEAESVYDRGCTLANSWRSSLLQREAYAYSDDLKSYRSSVSDSIVKVADLCGKKYDRFIEINKFRNNNFSFQKDVSEPLSILIDKLDKQNAIIDEGILDLLSPYLEDFQISVRKFGEWARASKALFRNMRNQC
ncbi:hypothetical protein CH352_18860 [Leptospira hartskeerlii]|uniref:Uncharacterized protein n=1 Tax=Leptospira hartskeerlii TaxID=2023177 RepID=A0A2M9X8B1_9LEPT|nr:hypothetical protein [Leptospira hartskeerlii]PJZ23895.1 hypothetical protein CH357_18795 [Leptospira hartskeerlii]PJZ31917.1 hypothetical protein CH352_18860 [Leptospira hartskeerlii]